MECHEIYSNKIYHSSLQKCQIFSSKRFITFELLSIKSVKCLMILTTYTFIKCIETAADLRLCCSRVVRIWCKKLKKIHDIQMVFKYWYNEKFVSMFRRIWITIRHNSRTILFSEIWFNISCDNIFGFHSPLKKPSLIFQCYIACVQYIHFEGHITTP